MPRTPRDPAPRRTGAAPQCDIAVALGTAMWHCGASGGQAGPTTGTISTTDTTGSAPPVLTPQEPRPCRIVVGQDHGQDRGQDHGHATSRWLPEAATMRRMGSE